MNEHEIIEILTMADAIWPMQQLNEPTLEVWKRALSDTERDEAVEAIEAFAKRPNERGRSHPPTPYQLVNEAKDIKERRLHERISRQRKLEEPPPLEERQAVLKGIRELRNRLFGESKGRS